ncbi:MAG TPA: FkbM family methyltransferase [Longimicrobiales bacterium]|nr:FkbM family methyltransferase [Longimicrobiales bacterium]
MPSGILLRALWIHRAWRYRLRVDPAEIRWMLGSLGPGDVAADVGAHKGAYTYWMRRAVGAEGMVLAYEPQPELADYLRRGVRAFGWRNVVVSQEALSSRGGERDLLVPAEGASPGASLVGASLPRRPRRVRVALDTLDRSLAEHAPGRRLRLLKCDVEGHELEVFLGADGVLREHRPRVLFECEARHLASGSPGDVFAHLHALGYRGWFFSGGRRLDVAAFDPGRHQVEGVRPYHNNFVFEPLEHERETPA